MTLIVLIGSFLGTLLIGFLLLPIIGTQHIIYILSGVLFLLSIALLIRERIISIPSINRLSITAFIIFFLVITVSFGLNKTTDPNVTKDFEVIYESESLYGKVKVVDDHKWNVRWLMSDSSTIGGRFLKTKKALFPFLYFLESARFFNTDAQKVLLIGLGAGYLPKALNKNCIVTDVIEIDPKIAFAAQKFFGFNPPGKFIIGDARFHIKGLEGKYDFIFHDTFTGGSVPYHLLSVEMIRDLKSLLNNKGILVLVYFGFSNGEQAIASCSVYKTINSVFPYVKTYVSRKNVGPVDIIFIASMHPLEFQNISDIENKNAIARKALNNMTKLEIKLPLDKGFVITDDYNPLESLQSQKAEAYRNNVIKLIGNEILLQ